MAMRRVLSKGMNLGRHGEVGYDELHKETGEQVSEGDRLHELGAKFEEDKTKLEDAIERVQASSIKQEDKDNCLLFVSCKLVRIFYAT